MTRKSGPLLDSEEMYFPVNDMDMYVCIHIKTSVSLLLLCVCVCVCVCPLLMDTQHNFERSEFNQFQTQPSKRCSPTLLHP